MEKNQKYIFLQALVITFIVFNIGIFMGNKLESSRIDKINQWYLESDLELLDQKIQSDAFGLIDFDCDLLVRENIRFADDIYEQAQIIEEYEKASRINNEIVIQHKRYDLLRTLFWINSIKIKEKCNPDYHNLVYFYKYNEPSLEQKSKQNVISNLLFQLKQEKQDKIMLIPIAADNNLFAINLLIEEYNITELPTVLIDEKIKIVSINELEEIDKYLN